MVIKWTVEATLVAPEPMGRVTRRGIVGLVEDALGELTAGAHGVSVSYIEDALRAGIRVHDVLSSSKTTTALHDRWTVPLRALIVEMPELAGWTTAVTVEPDPLDPEAGPAERHAAQTPTDEELAETFKADIEYASSVLASADHFRAFPLDELSVAGLNARTAEGRGIALRYATTLAGCLVHAADVLTDELFQDVATLRDVDDQSRIDIEDTWVLSALPPRFRPRYDVLFAQKFLVAFADLTRRVSGGWEPPACVAQELGVRVWLDQVESMADAPGLSLEDGWRGALEMCMFDDSDHEYLYSSRADGFEDDPEFGPGGMAPMGFDDWFKPFNDDRCMPVYSTEVAAAGDRLA
jgi:hypothetical protein